MHHRNPPPCKIPPPTPPGFLLMAGLGVLSLSLSLGRAGRQVFRMPDWLHHMLSAGRILFKKSFEAYMDQYLQGRVDTLLQEHRLVSLITQLRGARLTPIRWYRSRLRGARLTPSPVCLSRRGVL